MMYTFLIFLLLGLNVNGHGYLSKPVTRDAARASGTIWMQYMPIFDSTSSEFVCRNLPIGNTLKIKAGDNIIVQQGIHASHPGPCYFYLGNELRNEWYKFAEFENCETFMKNDYSLKIPNEAPQCLERGCVLRWEWHALHLRNLNGGKIEYYTNCVDIELTSNSKCKPDVLLKLPGHVPIDPNEYWYPWLTSNGQIPFKHTLPKLVRFNCNNQPLPPTPTPQPPSPTTPKPSPPSPTPTPQPPSPKPPTPNPQPPSPKPPTPNPQPPSPKPPTPTPQPPSPTIPSPKPTSSHCPSSPLKPCTCGSKLPKKNCNCTCVCAV
jgi:hypothetical protein